MCVELGEVYSCSVNDAGACVELVLVEKREGKEKDYEWGVAGEIIAKKVCNLNGVVCAEYSPVFKRLRVLICKKTDPIEATIRAILDIARRVMAHNRTAVGRVKTVLKEFGL